MKEQGCLINQSAAGQKKCTKKSEPAENESVVKFFCPFCKGDVKEEFVSNAETQIRIHIIQHYCNRNYSPFLKILNLSPSEACDKDGKICDMSNSKLYSCQYSGKCIKRQLSFLDASLHLGSQHGMLKDIMDNDSESESLPGFFPLKERLYPGVDTKPFVPKLEYIEYDTDQYKLEPVTIDQTNIKKEIIEEHVIHKKRLAEDEHFEFVENKRRKVNSTETKSCDRCEKEMKITELLSHYSSAHFSKQLFQRFPLRSEEFCKICKEEKRENCFVFRRSQKSNYIVHIGKVHLRVLEFLSKSTQVSAVDMLRKNSKINETLYEYLKLDLYVTTNQSENATEFEKICQQKANTKLESSFYKPILNQQSDEKDLKQNVLKKRPVNKVGKKKLKKEIENPDACVLCQSKEGKNLQFAGNLLGYLYHYSLCIYNQGGFRDLVPQQQEGDVTLSQQVETTGGSGVQYRYRCQPARRKDSECSRGVGYKEFCVHLGRQHGLAVRWIQNNITEELKPVLLRIQEVLAKQQPEVARQGNIPDPIVEELEDCVVCNAEDGKDGKELSYSRDKLDIAKFHYTVCLLKNTNVFFRILPPRDAGEDGRPGDLEGKLYQYTCTLAGCREGRRVCSYQEFVHHMSQEHGLLYTAMESQGSSQLARVRQRLMRNENPS